MLSPTAQVPRTVGFFIPGRDRKNHEKQTEYGKSQVNASFCACSIICEWVGQLHRIESKGRVSQNLGNLVTLIVQDKVNDTPVCFIYLFRVKIDVDVGNGMATMTESCGDGFLWNV